MVALGFGDQGELDVDYGAVGGAAAPERAEALIEQLVEEAQGLGLRVMTGRFGASMQVSLTNDGPVTLLIDTEKKF